MVFIAKERGNVTSRSLFFIWGYSDFRARQALSIWSNDLPQIDPHVSSPNGTRRRTTSVVSTIALIVVPMMLPRNSLPTSFPSTRNDLGGRKVQALRTMLSNFAARNWPELGLRRQSLGQCLTGEIHSAPAAPGRPGVAVLGRRRAV